MPDSNWKKKFEKAVKIDGIYTYNCPVLQKQKKIYDQRRVDGYSIDVNFFQYQYDLEVQCFLFYELYDTGIPREEHFWNAASLRWPTRVKDGKDIGAFCRNPWNENFIKKACRYKLVKLMGGSGQGKTKGAMAIMCMVWDHFIMTESGARCCFSSVTEKKLRTAAWSRLVELYRRTRPNISLYAGHGEVRASMEIRRKNYEGYTEEGSPREFANDSTGIMDGILVGGNEAQAAKGMDKLTGAHVPTALIFLLDEYQSMPVIPDDACFNLATHPVIFWVFQAGNPDSPDDPLGQGTEPNEGWDTVSVNDDGWESVDRYGRLGYTIHLNNRHSPGYDDPIKYHYLPTKEKEEELYGSDALKKTIQYYRMWLGWFPPASVGNSVINFPAIVAGKANTYPDIDEFMPVRNAMSFDSAPESVDRRQLTHFQSVVDVEGRWLLNFRETISLKKEQDEKYLFKDCEKIKRYMKRWEVPNGNIIIDGTTSHGHEEVLQEMGIHCKILKYQQTASDDYIDQSTQKKGKEECVNRIAEAAFLFERFIVNGQTRGLGDDFLPKDQLKMELCTRRWADENSRGLQLLEKKRLFISRMGFSPDIFDTCLQAAWFARTEWGMIPGANETQKKYNIGRQYDSSSHPNAVYDDEYDVIY